MKEEAKKVFFVQKIGEDQYETESIWCAVDGDNFIVDNIPFIAKRISLGDVIKAEFDDDENIYYFEDFVASSGNTTVRIFSYKSELMDSIRDKLSNMGCESEVLSARNIIAVNIPKEVNYSPIRAFLENGEQREDWTYEESCLEHEY
jgi:hypothetical protein